MTRWALCDADIIAYRVAARNEDTFDFEGEETARYVDHDFFEDVDKMVMEYADAVKADRVVICLSDPNVNWRKQLWEPYKGNRKNVEKPELLDAVKHYLASEYQSYVKERLEADDVMGILSTHPSLLEGEKIIVSEDKDMRTIPGLVYNPGRTEVGIMDISELDADRFHMWQTICGDQTDGYPGAKGVGKASVYAEEIIGADHHELWDIVLEAYASKGLTEDDAVLQARMARILRHYDYNFKTKKIRLWSPLWLPQSPA